ncbi:DUF1254 domain-containing protein [Parvibaculum sp.]|uniref:DUF1254 domain-containing protein n=1 Tax=Parvibaculum sp. TaxID=2024848 RepID=UPI002732161E|nr:DUF1254 domain-containing protein [Parvibaculum sp.]MDP1627437.1 DUF1254 domain-containing protein [Parvibaculum sp.]MDP2148616.1 DUF1254 domain-containing protein [Parvibaculum sp.]MDP3327573.1 DUF1254 domain-containing protein [Parvibaculum sp.]
MNRKLQWLAVVAALAVILHLAIVWAVPRVIMSVAMTKIGGEGALNTFTHPPRATDASRAVVRPSPDLAYSICLLDLSAGPVRIEVPASAPYTSLALYSSITDNYFVRNNREGEGLRDGEVIGLVVTGPGEEAPANLPEGVEAVTSPTKKGLALVRRVIENDAAMPRLDEIRSHSVCAPYGS